MFYDVGMEEVDKLPSVLNGVVDIELSGFVQTEQGSHGVISSGGYTQVIQDIVMYGDTMHILSADTIYRVISWN